MVLDVVVAEGLESHCLAVFECDGLVPGVTGHGQIAGVLKLNKGESAGNLCLDVSKRGEDGAYGQVVLSQLAQAGIIILQAAQGIGGRGDKRLVQLDAATASFRFTLGVVVVVRVDKVEGSQHRPLILEEVHAVIDIEDGSVGEWISMRVHEVHTVIPADPVKLCPERHACRPLDDSLHAGDVASSRDLLDGTDDGG